MKSAPLFVLVLVVSLSAVASAQEHDPLPPPLSREEEMRTRKVLTTLERSYNEHADKNAAELSQVRFRAETIKSQLGVNSPQYKHHLDLYNRMEADIKDQKMAMMCQFVFHQRYYYPPAIKVVERFARRHELKGIDFAFCKDHSSRYTESVQASLKQLNDPARAK